MRRIPQLMLIFSLLAACWLAMQVVHEFGHVIAAWWTGEVVVRVVLLPWTFSRTDLSVHPIPLLVIWAGPVLGAALPLLPWLVAKAMRCPGDYLLRFFAGFCLIANEAYIGGGAVYHSGDAGEILDHGSPSWPLFLFAAVTIPAGLWLWNGEGRNFGLVSASGKVSNGALATCVFALVAIVVLEVVLGLS